MTGMEEAAGDVADVPEDDVASEGALEAYSDEVVYLLLNGGYICYKFCEDTTDVTCMITDAYPGLTEVTIPSTIQGVPVTQIGPGAFEDCEQLTKVTLPDTITTIGDNAFDSCYTLESINIPDSVTSIGTGAFAITWELKEINIPEGITEIKDDTFNNCISLTNVSIPDSVTSIGNGAFCYCNELTEINISDNVTFIGDHAFGGCSNLQRINVGDGNSNYSSVDGVLFDKTGATLMCFPGGITGSYIIPDRVTTVDSSAFNSSHLSNLTISKNLTGVTGGLFSGSELENIFVLPDHELYKDIDGVLFDKTGTTLVAFPGGRTGSYTIPEGVTAIGELSFHNSNLTELNIPDSVKSIGESAFEGSNLINLYIPEGVSSIGRRAFAISDLVSVYIPDSAINLGYDLFSQCWDLTNVRLPETLTELTEGMFYDCTSLKEIHIPESVTDIIGYAFEGCESLERLIIPENVYYINLDGCFDCTSLTEVYILGNETDFSNIEMLENLEKVYCYRDSTAAFDLSYSGQLNFDIVYLDDIEWTPPETTEWTTQKVTETATETTTQATTDTTTQTTTETTTETTTVVTTVASGAAGDSAEWGLDADGKLSIGGSGLLFETAEETGWTQYKDEIISAMISYGIESIPSGAFSGCTNLKEINLPDSITEIADDAFEGCGDVTFTCTDNSYGAQYLTAKGLAYKPVAFVGDISGDGIITAADASATLQKTLDASFKSDAEKYYISDVMSLADANADNRITASDASEILQKTLDNSYQMPVEK